MQHPVVSLRTPLRAHRSVVLFRSLLAVALCCGSRALMAAPEVSALPSTPNSKKKIVTDPSAAAESPLSSSSEFPCKAALPLFRRSLRAVPNEALKTWPLYEAKLKVELAANRVSGKLRILQAKGDEARTLVLPREGGTDAASMELFTIQRGPTGALQGLQETGEGRLLMRLPPAADLTQPLTTELSLRTELPTLGPISLFEAFGALAPGSQLGLVGRQVLHARGATLVPALPYLMDPAMETGRGGRGGDAAPKAPAAFGAPVAGVPACVLLQIDHPRGTRVRGGGIEVGHVLLPDGHLRSTRVGLGLRRVGLVIEYAAAPLLTAKRHGVTLRVSAGTKSGARKLLGWAKRGLPALEASLGPYPFSTLEIASLPLSGAVDGIHAPGLVVISDVFEGEGDALATAALNADGNGEALYELALLHQMAHQWVGEWVATPGPNAPVIEELLAGEAVRRAASRLHGKRAGASLSRKVMGQLYKSYRGLGGEDGAADRSADQLGFSGWVGLCAGKGALTLGSVDGLLGEARVGRRLRALLSRYAWKTLSRADLERGICEAKGEKLSKPCHQRFTRWLDQVRGDLDLGSSATLGAPSMNDPNLQGLMQQLLQGLQGGP